MFGCILTFKLNPCESDFGPLIVIVGIACLTAGSTLTTQVKLYDHLSSNKING